jgi:AraC family transcriptional activator of pobA
MNNMTTLGGNSVFVAGISGSVRNISAQLRLDGANGYNKYIFVKKGSGKCMIDGITQGFGTNTVIYVPDSCPHHIDLGVNTQAYAIAIPVDMEFNLPSQPVVLALDTANDITTMVQMFDAALQEFNSGNTAAEMAIYSYTGLVTVNVTRLLAQQADCAKNTAAQRLMRKFSYLVEDQFFTGQGLEHYARILGVTSTHLTRVCQQLNGQSASHFIQDRIISEARRLLLISNRKVQDIAEDLGFRSAAYFTRFFSTRLGMSPKEFRHSRDRFRRNLEVSAQSIDIAV